MSATVKTCEPGKYRYEWRKSQQTPMPRFERVAAALVRDRDAFVTKKSNVPAITKAAARAEAASLFAPKSERGKATFKFTPSLSANDMRLRKLRGGEVSTHIVAKPKGRIDANKLRAASRLAQWDMGEAPSNWTNGRTKAVSRNWEQRLA